MQDYDYYSTNDLALAAALSVRGFSVQKIHFKRNDRRAFFDFVDTSQLRKAVDDYWTDKLAVNPKAYFDALKHIKTRIYARG